MTDGDLELVVLAAVGVLYWLLGRGMQGLRPSRWYGVRTPATYADARVWRDANTRAGHEMQRLGITLTAVTLALIPLPDDTALWLATAVLIGGTLGLASRAWRYANQRLAYYREQDERRRGSGPGR